MAVYMAILVTGGLGFVGSHTVVQLINSGESVVILDNLSNSKLEVCNRIKSITGLTPHFVKGDVRDSAILKDIFSSFDIDVVIHFAGLKSVLDSKKDPLAYFNNNVSGSIALLKEMDIAGVKNFIFSSSATVYGQPQFLPYSELHPLTPANVYGQTKLMVEQILLDLHVSDSDWKIGILRYFNPVGAHSSGLIGEDPSGIPNNLMPFLSQVAVGKLDYLSVYGNDYNTEDGTAKRDYIHVDDLAFGHIAALNYLKNKSSLLIANLGTGKSTSVLELVRAFEIASGRAIPLKIVGRRSGDVPEYYANPQHAKNVLGWTAHYDLDRMCKDSYRWQSMNPNGYN
jgi:UDP-glucose 4-epimerase